MLDGEVRTQIDINASSDKVWDALMDFDIYKDWNPFIVELKVADGTEMAVDTKLSASMVLPTYTKAQTFTPKVVKVDKPNEFRWRGSLPIPFLFTGEHVFSLESTSPTTTKLHHYEQFHGLLVPLLGGILKKTEQGFNLMNEALKKRVEGN